VLSNNPEGLGAMAKADRTLVLRTEILRFGEHYAWCVTDHAEREPGGTIRDVLVRGYNGPGVQGWGIAARRADAEREATALLQEIEGVIAIVRESLTAEFGGRVMNGSLVRDMTQRAAALARIIPQLAEHEHE
jgi:hypothetical protein